MRYSSYLGINDGTIGVRERSRFDVAMRDQGDCQTRTVVAWAFTSGGRPKAAREASSILNVPPMALRSEVSVMSLPEGNGGSD